MSRWSVFDTGAAALVRVLVATVFGAALFLGVGLFGGIVYLMIRAARASAPVDMSAAYHNVAFPAALVGAVAGLVAGLVFEQRTRKLRG